MNNISIEHFIYFNEAAKLESVTQASKSLRVSSSSISSSISNIENSFGVELFERKGRRIFLNEHGEKLQKEVQKILKSYDQLPNIFGKEVFELEGHYRFGGSHFLTNNILPGALASLIDTYKNFKVDIFSMETNYLIRKVQSGEIDFGLVFGHIPHDDIREIIISEMTMVPVVRVDHPLKGKSWMNKISQYPGCIHKPGLYADRCDNHPMFSKFKIDPSFKAYWDSDDSAYQLLMNGNYWTLLPEVVVQKRKELRQLELPEGWFAPTKISLIYRESRTKMVETVSILKKYLLNELVK